MVVIIYGLVLCSGGPQESDVDELDREVDDDRESAAVAEKLEEVLLLSHAADVCETVFHILEAGPLALLGHRRPFLESGFRLRMITDKLHQWLFGKNSHSQK